MDSTQIDQMMIEIDLGDETAMDTYLDGQIAGTIYEDAARTKNSVFFNLFYQLITEPYRRFRKSVRSMLPQLFLNSATGAWLDAFSLDYDVPRNLGQKAQYKLRLNKASGATLSVPVDAIFYVHEATPRRYKITDKDQKLDFAATDPDDCFVTVEAEEIGTRYNLLDGQISRSLSPMANLVSIANIAEVQPGRDVETDEELRARIFAKKWSQNLQYGVDAKYAAALQSVANVRNCLLTSVQENTGELYYTIFIDGNPTDTDAQNIAAEAQLALNSVLMATDKAEVTSATPQAIAVGVTLHVSADQTLVTDLVKDFFAQIEPGTDFYSSLLSDWLYDRISALAGTPIEITPVHEAIAQSTFFEPTLTLTVPQ